MVVDFHVHCFPDELAHKAVPLLAKGAGVPAFSDGTLSAIRYSMDKAGIDKSVILSIATKPIQTKVINDWSAEIQGEDIIAFGSIHPEYESKREELYRIKRMGLKGIKLHPDYQQFFVDDKIMFPVYELAQELGLIIVFHAGVDIGLPKPYHCTPERLLRVLKAFPQLTIVAAHMGGYKYWDEVEQLLVGKEIYLDTSYAIGWMSDEQALRIIKNHGYEKIIFGTDSPWGGQLDVLDKIRDLKLDKLAEEAILGKNAEKLLGLEK